MNGDRCGAMLWSSRGDQVCALRPGHGGPHANDWVSWWYGGTPDGGARRPRPVPPPGPERWGEDDPSDPEVAR